MADKFSDCVFVSEYDNSFGNIGKSYSKARGRYIVDFTDDDRMLPGHLSALYHEMEKDKNIALAFCPAYCIDSDGKRTGEIKGAFKEPVTFDDMLVTQRMVMSATMYRKLAYVRPHEKLTGVCGEWFKYLEIFNSGNRIVALDEPRVELRIHNGSDSYIRGIKENGFAKAHLKAWNHWIKWRGKSMSDERWREMLGVLNGLAAGTNDYEKIMAEAIGLMKLDRARRV